jgi:hypothetical protein
MAGDGRASRARGSQNLYDHDQRGLPSDVHVFLESISREALPGSDREYAFCAFEVATRRRERPILCLVHRMLVGPRNGDASKRDSRQRPLLLFHGRPTAHSFVRVNCD